MRRPLLVLLLFSVKYDKLCGPPLIVPVTTQFIVPMQAPRLWQYPVPLLPQPPRPPPVVLQQFFSRTRLPPMVQQLFLPWKLINNLQSPIISQELQNPVTDITYHFFSNKNPDQDVPLNRMTVSQLRSTSFSPLKETIFIIHGWQGDKTSSLDKLVRNNIFVYNDVNVITVDWGKNAKLSYIWARGSVKEIGKQIADFIRTLVYIFQVQLHKVTLIGHSLGAHVSGNAGSALGGQLGKIIGLDPAGPLFWATPSSGRLDKNDARLVHVIHTNCAILGLQDPVGHADYYPNGGYFQPGCGLDLKGICAHGRAYEYYAESLISGNFIAKRCVSYVKYELGMCPTAPMTTMGGLYLDRRAMGTYFLSTNSETPFARGPI